MTRQSVSVALREIQFVKRVHDFAMREIAMDSEGVPLNHEQMAELLFESVRLWQAILDDTPAHLRDRLIAAADGGR